LNISLAGFFPVLIFSVIGMWMINEGRRKLNFQIGFIGFALCAYTYFTSGLLWDWGIGIFLCVLAYFVW
jgi:hypothetical protein